MDAQPLNRGQVPDQPHEMGSSSINQTSNGRTQTTRSTTPQRSAPSSKHTKKFPGAPQTRPTLRHRRHVAFVERKGGWVRWSFAVSRRSAGPAKRKYNKRFGSASGDCRIRRILGVAAHVWSSVVGDARSGEMDTMLGLSVPSLGGRAALDRVCISGMKSGICRFWCLWCL